MTQPVPPPCPAGVSEVVPTVATGPLRAEMTLAAVRFTSLLTSFPQLTAIQSACCDRMNNFTPPRPLHSSNHPSRSPGDPAIGRAMTRRQTCHDVQRDHSQAKSRRRGDAVGASDSVYAHLRPTGKGIAVRHRHQPPTRLEPLLARAAIDDPDEQLITIESNNQIVDHQKCDRPQGGSHSASNRVHAAPEHVHQESRQLNSDELAAATAAAARREGRQR
jgi:hypothetical protein